ncbi:uncharacterized protein ACBR49_008801 isoform 1-T1 [Aulostomus maculatus]
MLLSMYTLTWCDAHLHAGGERRWTRQLMVVLHPGPGDQKHVGTITSLRSGPESLRLSRCAGCYNQQKSTSARRGGHSESSSSSEESGPEVDWESDAESSSSSSSTGKPEADECPPGPGGQDGARQLETQETRMSCEEDEKAKEMILTVPLVESLPLPASPHLSVPPAPPT